MTSLAVPPALEPPLLAQPVLCAGGERYLLPPGVHGLGGRAPDSIRLEPLDNEARAAVITVSDDGKALLQRTTAAIMVRIDGQTIGVGPVELRHGDTIEFGECRLRFEADPTTASLPRRRTGERPVPVSTPTATAERPVRPCSMSPAGGAAAQAPRQSNAEQTTGAALVMTGTGARHALPARRIYIGRDDSCDVIVRGNSVSRRHASIAPVAGGFMLRDESVNGTLVNGVRVVGTYLLGNGDVVRVQDEEIRVERDASAPAPTVREEKTTRLDLSYVTRGVTEERAREVVARQPTASLEIVRGPFAGASFQVDRAVCSIGRGEENDVRIRDDTVSLTHATLLRKRGAWFVVDLRSMNGTYVDGSRVSGERELHTGARVRVGAVELSFRAIECEEHTPEEPRRIGFWARVRSLLRSIAPPGLRSSP